MDLTGNPRMRLDRLLADTGRVRSRSAARDAILRGQVRVNGRVADKPGLIVPQGAEIELNDPASGYVARSAMKLIAGLDHFGFDPAGLTILDLGASTGGFTQVLLERGAKTVIAADVGRDQLAPDLRANRRIVSLEGLSCRDLTRPSLGGRKFQGLVCDVSFISLKTALPPSLELAEPGCWAVFLVKPQFEVGRDHVGKQGLVRDPEVAKRAVRGVAGWLDGQLGWQGLSPIDSPISGAEGNREYLLGATKQAL